MNIYEKNGYLQKLKILNTGEVYCKFGAPGICDINHKYHHNMAKVERVYVFDLSAVYSIDCYFLYCHTHNIEFHILFDCNQFFS